MNVMIATVNYSEGFKKACRGLFPNDQKLNHGVDTGQMEVGAYLKGLTVISVPASQIFSAIDAKGNYSHADTEAVVKIRSAADAETLLGMWRREVKDILG